MGFDKNTEGQPLMNVRKADTKTNLLVVLGVVVFFLIAAAVMFYYMRTPAETRNEAHRDQVQEGAPGN